MRFLFTPRTLLLTKFLVAIACLHPIGSVAQTEPPRPSSSPSLVQEEAPTLEEVVVTGQSGGEGDAEKESPHQTDREEQGRGQTAGRKGRSRLSEPRR
jgi:hypothetical protein